MWTLPEQGKTDGIDGKTNEAERANVRLRCPKNFFDIFIEYKVAKGYTSQVSPLFSRSSTHE